MTDYVRDYSFQFGRVIIDLLMTSALLRDCLDQKMKKYERSKLVDLHLWCFFCINSLFRILTILPFFVSQIFKWPQGCCFRWVLPRNEESDKYASIIVILQSYDLFPRSYSTAPRIVHEGSVINSALRWPFLLHRNRNHCRWLSYVWKSSLILLYE